MSPSEARTEAPPLHHLRTFIATLRRDLRARDLRTGVWYSKLLHAYLDYYEHRPKRAELRAGAVTERPELARELIDRTALWSALSGTLAAGGVTAASVAMANTMFLAAPVVVPLAGLGLLSELLLRVVLHLQLTCELAELYGIPFHPEGESELIRVSALALRAEMHETEDDPGRGLIERVAHTQEAGTLGKLIATGLVGESLLRNAIPFADVAVSSLRNWQLTHQVGRFVQGYASRRVALEHAVARLAERSPERVNLLLEGVWFIFISDGRLTGVETALLAFLMRARDTDADLTTHFVSDEAAWLEQLRNLPPDREIRELYVRALEVAAAIEEPVTPAELAILRRASETLGVPLTAAETARQLEEIAASSRLSGEHEEAGVNWRERANTLAREVAGRCARTLHRIRARPHIVTIQLSPQLR